MNPAPAHPHPATALNPAPGPDPYCPHPRTPAPAPAPPHPHVLHSPGLAVLAPVPIPAPAHAHEHEPTSKLVQTERVTHIHRTKSRINVTDCVHCRPACTPRVLLWHPHRPKRRAKRKMRRKRREGNTPSWAGSPTKLGRAGTARFRSSTTSTSNSGSWTGRSSSPGSACIRTLSRAPSSSVSWRRGSS